MFLWYIEFFSFLYRPERICSSSSGLDCNSSVVNSVFPYHLNPADLIQYQFNSSSSVTCRLLLILLLHHLLVLLILVSGPCLTSVAVHWGTAASVPDYVQSCLWKCTNNLHHGERASQRPGATTSKPGWARMRAEHDPWNGIRGPEQLCLCLRNCVELNREKQAMS